MQTVLIAGGAGFIGSNLVRRVLDTTDARIVVLDKLTYASSQTALETIFCDPRVELIRGDITDPTMVLQAFSVARPVAILNLAAETHVDRSIDSSKPFVDTNVTGTIVLLDAARRWLKEIDCAARSRFRFLHVSTDEVFGSLGSTGYFTESTRYAPRSPYAASKAAADHLVSAYHHTHGLPTLITNCSNNYGPFQHPEKLIPLMILNALDARPLPIYGDGRNVRDWLHVDDHCSALMRVLADGIPGETYNIGGNSERSNIEVVTALCEALEELNPAATNLAMRSSGLSRYEELKHFVNDRPGHDRRYAIDASKIRRELGWIPTWRFEEGVRATVAWYLTNRDGFTGERIGYGRERLGLGTTAI